MSTYTENDINKIFLNIIQTQEWTYDPKKKIDNEKKKFEEWENIKTILKCYDIDIADPKEKWRKMREAFVRKHKRGKEHQLNYCSDIQFLVPFINHKNDSRSMMSVNDSGECSELLAPSDLSVSQNNEVMLRNTEANQIMEIEEDVMMDENFSQINNNSFKNSCSGGNGIDLQTMHSVESDHFSIVSDSTNLSSTVFPIKTFQILGQTSKTPPSPSGNHSGLSTCLQHVSKNFSSGNAPTISTLHNSLDVSNFSSNEISTLTSPSETSSSPTSVSKLSQTSSFLSTESSFYIPNAHLKPVPVSMFTITKVLDDNRKSKTSAGISRSSSIASIGQVPKNGKNVRPGKFKSTIIPPLDDFAIRKKKKQDDSSNVASEAMSEISKNMTEVSTKLSDYISLKSKLLNSQMQSDSQDDLFNIIKREFSSLALSDQRIILKTIRDEIDFF